MSDTKATEAKDNASERDESGEVREVEVLQIEDDLDTGMHRVNVCPS